MTTRIWCLQSPPRVTDLTPGPQAPPSGWEERPYLLGAQGPWGVLGTLTRGESTQICKRVWGPELPSPGTANN